MSSLRESPYVGMGVVVLLDGPSISEGIIVSDSGDDTAIELEDGRLISGKNHPYRLKEDIPSDGDLLAAFFG